MRLLAIPVLIAAVAALPACKRPEAQAEARPVRTMVVQTLAVEDDRQAVGEVRPRYESELSDAVIAATEHRLRPILLTAAAAILGMIPIAPIVFWGPMAYAVIGGLMVATLLTLVFLPALYVAWFRITPPVETPDSRPADIRQALPAP